MGTANSLVYLVGEGVVLNEPTVVALSTLDKKVVAVGNEAKEMLGRTPENIVALRPMKDGVIANYKVTEAMLSNFIDKVCGKNRLFKPEVMVCVPAGCTQVERRAVFNATVSAGARTAYLIEEPLAAAIGAKIPIAQPQGHMVVDAGGGSTESAIISLGGVVLHRSVRVAGNALDEAITRFIKKKFNLIIGERTAEQVKIKIGSALPLKEELKMFVKGRDSLAGLPREVEVASSDVTQAIGPVLQKILSAPKQVLEETPPELAADIIDQGIILAGGTSLLKNLDQFLTQETGVPCHVAEEPILCVVRGTGVVLENIELYKRSISRR